MPLFGASSCIKVPWQKLTILNAKGQKLVGILDDTSSPEVIVLCHGFRSCKEEAVLLNLTSAFLRDGLSTFRFDFSGSGESEGDFQYGSYWKDADDLRSVVKYLRNEGRKVEILVGHSKGGNAVLLYASKYNDVQMVVNICGRFHLRNGIRKRLGENHLEALERHGYVDVKDRYGNFEYRVTHDSLKERLSTDMEKALLSIPRSCRVLTVHGSRDETVSSKDASEFHRCVSNHTLRIVEGADHYFRQHQNALCWAVLSFVEEDGPRPAMPDESCIELASRL